MTRLCARMGLRWATCGCLLVLCGFSACSRKRAPLAANLDAGAGPLPAEVVRSINGGSDQGDPGDPSGPLAPAPTTTPLASVTPQATVTPDDGLTPAPTPEATATSEPTVAPVITALPTATPVPTPTPDVTPPQPPVVTSPIAGSAFTSGGTTLTLAGTCESGATVYISGNMSGSVACSSGQFSFLLEPGADGTFVYTLTQRDAAGNTSLATSFAWTRDTAIPVSPVLSPIPASLSSETVFGLAGICTTGYTVVLAGSASADEVVPGLTQSCVGGAFLFRVTKTLDGKYSFVLTQKNESNVASAPISHAWTRDSSAPLRPSLSLPVQTTTESASYTSANNTVFLSGSCEPKANVRLRNVGSGATEASVSCGDAGSFSFSTATHVADATYNFEITQSDLAGNASAALLFTWDHDTTIPFTPELTDGSGAGFASPFYARANPLTVVANCDTSGPADVILDAPATLTVSPSRLVVCTTGSVTFTISAPGDGSFPLSVSQTDPGTGASSSSAMLVWNLDRFAPAAPVVSSPGTNPFVSSGSLTLVGTCEPTATVRISDGGTNTDSVCSPLGKFSFGPVSKPLPASYDFLLSQTDRAGNSSGTLTFTWTKDDNVLAPVTVLSPATSTFASNAASLSIQGTCSGSNQVRVTEAAILRASTTCSDGFFSLSVPEASEGTRIYLVTQKNGLLESSPVQLEWTRDVQIPTVNLVSAPPATNYSSNVSVVFTLADNLDDAPDAECSWQGGAYAPCSSPWSRASVAAGSLTLLVRARDAAGNVSAVLNVGWTQVQANALALFPFDGNADDGSVFSTDLSLGGSPGWTSPVKFLQGLTGAAGGYASVRNSSVATQLGYPASLLTVEFWMKNAAYQQTSSSDFYFAQSQISGGVVSWAVGMTTTKARGKNAATCSLFFGYGSTPSATAFTLIKSTSLCAKVTDGLAHHVAVTFQNGAVKFFVDGALQSSGSAPISTLNRPSGLLLTVGRALSTTALNFAVDDLRVSQNIRYTGAFAPTGSAFVAD